MAKMGLYANRCKRYATMQKLMTCDRNNFQFQPKVSAVSRTISVMPPLLAAIIRFINYVSGATSIAFPLKLVNEIKSVENDRLGQCDGENSVHEHLREGTGIATDRAGHSQTGQANSDSDAHRGKPDVNASAHFC